ncbi:prepilin-type N-terminal cleavage/methylation domain-containing protein [Sansalvadorimonas sp. 2012CJ34-2]|uniref:Prepilin-type N-terminal cleavage/methylation domain-containing protein n=1 Tax=Parendozoicomonas callyspongiae TaxID=2942213 RepID=A0ABT0PHW9_9GAMM|nr:prepilin-type N-terminal cleavage/methylation domain-containing protein [Sansalvadorimonas sp. 2012CJ34-2]MCL6270969.1 prepilin-type N-terminal cleavage/methylation domain-containing protein [Sansalvadorimonas sp. 2012CJ34-2]
MNKCTNNKKGFSTIELLIGVAIVGVLSFFAVKLIILQTSRTIVADEIIPLFKEHSINLFEFYATDGKINRYCSTIPGGSESGSLSVETKYLTSLHCSPKTSTSVPFRFTAIFDLDVMPDDFPANARLVYFPILNGVSLTWYCATHFSGEIPQDFLPKECRQAEMRAGDQLFVDGVNVTAQGLFVE